MFLDKFAPYKFSKTQQMETNDGLAWSAVLMLGKTKVLHVQDGGYGGGLEVTALDPAAYKAFEEHVAGLPLEFFDDGIPLSFTGEAAPPPDTLNDRVETFLTSLGDATENDKRYRRMCRTKTIARWKGDPPGEFRVYGVAFTPAVAEAIRKKEGDNLDFILNERLR